MKSYSKLLVVVACLATLASCSDVYQPSDDPDELKYAYSSRHFDYYISDDDPVTPDTTFQELYLDWVVRQLGVSFSEKIAYHKYQNRSHLSQVTGLSTNAAADYGENRLHTIWPVDNHEITHLILDQSLGRPPALFDEGMAVAYQAAWTSTGDININWNGRDFHSLAKEYLSNNQIPQLDDLLETYGVWEHDANITYPLAGSFVSHLISQNGIGTIKAFLDKSEFANSPSKIKADFNEVVDLELEQAWLNWLSFVESY